MSASDDLETVPAVTNSACLIGLERIERLDILPRVFSSITIPTAVSTEVATPKTQLEEGEAEAIAGFLH